MKLNRTLFAPILLALATLLVMGCEVEPTETDSDADTSTGVDTAGVDTAEDTTTGPVYTFIRVDDLSTDVTGEDPGADIDAINLIKAADSRRVFANSVSSYSAATTVRSGDANEALGAPDGFPTFATDGSTATCQLYKDLTACQAAPDDATACAPTFVSMGGTGGYVIVSIPDGEMIEEGDTVQVFEMGNCEFESKDNPGTTGNAAAEPVKIQVSIAGDVDGSWVVVSDTGEGPLIAGTVPALPTN